MEVILLPGASSPQPKILGSTQGTSRGKVERPEKALDWLVEARILPVPETSDLTSVLVIVIVIVIANT